MKLALLLGILLNFQTCWSVDVPNTLTGTNAYTNSLTVPAAGDNLAAAGVDNPYQTLLNNDNNIRTLQLISGVLLWRGNLQSVPATNHILLGNISHVVIGGVTLNADVATFDAGSLANNTRYYIYTYNNSGTLAYEKSTVAPDANLVFKAGDTTRVYLGTFLSTGSGGIVSFSALRGRYTYRFSDLSSPLLTSNLGPSASQVAWTARSLATWVPPTSSMANILLKVTNGTADGNSKLSVRTTGDTASDSAHVGGDGTATGVLGEKPVRIQTDAVQSIEAQLDVSAGTATGSIYILGFEE